MAKSQPSSIQHQAWAETAWTIFSANPSAYIENHDLFGRIQVKALCDAVDSDVYASKTSVMDRVMHRSQKAPDHHQRGIMRQVNQYLYYDHDQEALARQKQREISRQQHAALAAWVTDQWRAFLMHHPVDRQGLTVTTVLKHWTVFLLPQASFCPVPDVAKKLAQASAIQARSIVQMTFWPLIPQALKPVHTVPGLPAFLLHPEAPQATQILQRKQAASQRALQRQNARYFHQHGTTSTEAEHVWHRLQLPGPMPARGFWNDGTTAWFSSSGIQHTPAVTLLSHLKLSTHYGVQPIAFATTPYGISSVYRTADLLAAQQASQHRIASYRPAQALVDLSLSDLVACLVWLNRHARKLQHLVPTLYAARRFGLVRYYKEQKDAAYQLKDAALLRLAPHGTLTWHKLSAGWHAALTFPGPHHRSYTFHLPAIPDPAPEDFLAISAPFPVRSSPRWQIQGHILRLQDAQATLAAYVAHKAIPAAAQALVTAHDRSEARYLATRSSTRRRWYDEEDW